MPPAYRRIFAASVSQFRAGEGKSLLILSALWPLVALNVMGLLYASRPLDFHLSLCSMSHHYAAATTPPPPRPPVPHSPHPIIWHHSAPDKGRLSWVSSADTLGGSGICYKRLSAQRRRAGRGAGAAMRSGSRTRVTETEAKASICSLFGSSKTHAPLAYRYPAALTQRYVEKKSLVRGPQQLLASEKQTWRLCRRCDPGRRERVTRSSLKREKSEKQVIPAVPRCP
ncbi:unnamed protein product [Merluccius merluccius]